MQEKTEGLNAKQEDTYNIVERSLWDFLQEIVKAVKAGYTLSDESKNFPQADIFLFTCTLVKEEKVEPVAEVTTNVADVTTAVKKSAGRPSKGK